MKSVIIVTTGKKVIELRDGTEGIDERAEYEILLGNIEILRKAVKGKKLPLVPTEVGKLVAAGIITHRKQGT